MLSVKCNCMLTEWGVKHEVPEASLSVWRGLGDTTINMTSASMSPLGRTGFTVGLISGRRVCYGWLNNHVLDDGTTVCK